MLLKNIKRGKYVTYDGFSSKFPFNYTCYVDNNKNTFFKNISLSNYYYMKHNNNIICFYIKYISDDEIIPEIVDYNVKVNDKDYKLSKDIYDSL